VGRPVSRNTLRTLLKTAGLSWKKCKKLLAKADPKQREDFVTQFQKLYEQMCQADVVLIYLDEVHLHQDMEVGYTWSPVGEADWVPSTSPCLANRINWFGAYNFTDGDCFIWENGTCDSETCTQFLQQLHLRFTDETRKNVLIWDGASYHRSRKVRALANQLGFTILPLPAYSPDLNPIEGLWKWMREEVTQHYCHATLDELRRSCLDFIASLALIPEQVVNRLWPHFDLDPDVEKFRLSF
jgi:transposase